MRFFLTLSFILLLKGNVYAASCCGGGSSSSLILVGDNIQEYSLSFSYRNDLGQTDNVGWSLFHNDSVIDRQNALNFQLQRQITDRYQLAAKSGVVEKNIKKQNRHEKTTGLSDIEMQLTYEILPEYTYSPWKPRGFLYTKISKPMSRSLYDSSSSIYSDVRGSGLYTAGLGTFFIKNISSFTLKTTIEWQHFFGKDFGNSSLSDYDKFMLPLGVSYALTSLPVAVGAGASWSYQTSKKLQGARASTSDQEYFWDINGFVNWVITREHAVGLSYSDSTLVGKNVNSPLYRSLSLTYTNSTPL